MRGTGMGFDGAMVSIGLNRAGMTRTIAGKAAAVDEVKLTIRSSRSALSDNPLGPSASIGSACATGRTHVRSTRLMMTNSRPSIGAAYAERDIDVQGPPASM